MLEKEWCAHVEKSRTLNIRGFRRRKGQLKLMTLAFFLLLTGRTGESPPSESWRLLLVPCGLGDAESGGGGSGATCNRPSLGNRDSQSKSASKTSLSSSARDIPVEEGEKYYSQRG